MISGVYLLWIRKNLGTALLKIRTSKSLIGNAELIQKIDNVLWSSIMRIKPIFLVVFLTALFLSPKPALADGIIIPSAPICDPGPCPPTSIPLSQLEIRYHHVDVKIERPGCCYARRSSLLQSQRMDNRGYLYLSNPSRSCGDGLCPMD